MEKDKLIFDIIEREHQRQKKGIELIASENFVSDDVMRAMGSCLTNKYAEGYPGHRYYGGCQVVDEIGIGSYVVFYRLEHEAGEIHRRTVRKVTSVREVETHKLVARLEHSHENSHISLCSRVGLYISPLSAKNLLEALDSDGFCLVNYLTAAIVTVTGIALGILVGKA